MKKVFIAPNDGEKLLQALQREKVNNTTADPGLETLVAAHRRAPSKMLRTQILSMNANKFKVSEIDLLKISVLRKKGQSAQLF